MNTGELEKAGSELSIGGLASPPSGATGWERSIRVLFARYDFHPGEKRNPPAYTDSKGIVRVALGNFEDSVTPSELSRKGRLWMVDSLWNLSESLFVSGRISEIALNGNKTASFNGIPANTYRRNQIGLSYRVNARTNLKFEYQMNEEKPEEKDNNVFGALFTVLF
ncbi:MAG: hypothetical protein ACK4G3_03920 [bacterium]